jgi:uncharacterized membrane protein YesL
MKKIFSPDSALFSIVESLINMMLLNMLYLLFCIPIVTIGPATAALHYVTLKYVSKEEERVWAPFIHSFKQNLKQGMIIGVIATGIGAFLAFDLYVLYPQAMNGSWPYMVLFLMVVLASIIYLMIMAYVYPLLARYDNSLKQMLRTALVLSIRHLPATACLAVISAAPIAMMFGNLAMVVFALGFYCIIGFSAIAFFHDQLIYRIFIQYTPRENPEEEETE